jgi:hypothetical protein
VENVHRRDNLPEIQLEHVFCDVAPSHPFGSQSNLARSATAVVATPSIDGDQINALIRTMLITSLVRAVVRVRQAMPTQPTKG